MEKAIFELSEKLRHPSDIATKLESMESGFKSKAEVHNKNFVGKLAVAYDDIKIISDGIKQLSAKVDNFKELKTRNINGLKEFTGLVRDSKRVNQICLAHQNFARVQRFMNELKTAEDECRNEDIGEYHEKIYNKEEFMYELDQYNTELEREDFDRINRIENTIKRQSVEFTSLLIEIMDEFVTNYQVLKQINKIVQKEERRDELTRLSQEGDKSKDAVMVQYARSYPQYVTRTCKNLKLKLTNVLKNSIRAKFKKSDEVFTSRIKFVLKDLDEINENVHLEFFTFDEFIAEYHTNLKMYIEKNIDDLDAGEILALIEFKTEYYNQMETKYNKVAESLGDQLLSGETELLERYSKTASGKLSQWIENITTAEIDKMRSRDMEITRDENDKLISSGFINLLQIIKMQLEPISFNRRVFLQITNTVRENCEEFRKKIVEEVKRDCELSCQGKSSPGFEDYCILFGNSGLKLAQYITALPQCQSMEIRDLGNVFMGILQECNASLSEFVIHTCQPVLNKIFKDEWYSKRPTNTLLVTLEDFLQDYKDAMSPFSFSTFIYELSNAISNAYLAQLRSKRIVLNDESGDTLRQDYEQLKEMLLVYADLDDIEETLGILIKLVPLLETRNPDVFSVELDALRLQSSSCDETMVRNIIVARRDIETDIKKELETLVDGLFSETHKKKGSIFGFG